MPTDALIVAGVSNWGAYGLLAAIASLNAGKRSKLLQYFNREMDHKYLSAAVEIGQAVDDSRLDRKGRPQMSVDNLPWEHHAAVLEEIRGLVLETPPS